MRQKKKKNEERRIQITSYKDREKHPWKWAKNCQEKNETDDSKFISKQGPQMTRKDEKIRTEVWVLPATRDQTIFSGQDLSANSSEIDDPGRESVRGQGQAGWESVSREM